MARSGSTTGNTKSRTSASLYWFFTWNNFLEGDIDKMVARCDELCDMYVFEREVGESGTPHLQGKIKFLKKNRPIESFRDISEKIHWEKSATWKGHEYCAKDGTKLGEDIWYKGFTPILAPKLEGWQIELEKMLPEMKERNVHWFYEEKGGVGKTDFCRWICLKKKALMVGGRSQDMKCAIASMKTKPGIVVVNLARGNKLSYTGIEEVSDGIFFSSKYESEMVIFNKPIIIVFSNEQPEWERLSMDRWRVYNIQGDALKRVEPPAADEFL